MTKKNSTQKQAPLPRPDGSRYLLRLPGKPTKADALWELERMIHQWDDSPRPEGAQGYHRDALWLEEIRHVINSLEKDKARLDWLESHPLKTEVRGGPEDGHVGSAWAIASNGEDIREAIDAWIDSANGKDQ